MSVSWCQPNRQQPSITLSIATKERNETVNTTVQVVDKEQPPESSIRIEIVPDPAGQWRAAWDRNEPNRLNVYAEHQTLARYLKYEADKYLGQDQPHFRILLAEIVAEKVVQRIMVQKMESNPRFFEEPNAFFFLHSEEMTAFLPIAHKIMISDSDARKLLEGVVVGVES